MYRQNKQGMILERRDDTLEMEVGVSGTEEEPTLREVVFDITSGDLVVN